MIGPTKMVVLQGLIILPKMVSLVEMIAITPLQPDSLLVTEYLDFPWYQMQSGVFGANNNGGVGVGGNSGRGTGIKGNSDTGVAIDGFSGNGDGIVGATGSSAKNGIIGRIDATNPSPDGPVGNGIFGFSMVPNASGVFGANNNGGVGVSGNGKTGVFGFSQDFIGVSGISNTNTGIFGRGRIAGRFKVM